MLLIHLESSPISALEGRQLAQFLGTERDLWPSIAARRLICFSMSTNYRTQTLTIVVFLSGSVWPNSQASVWIFRPLAMQRA